MTETPTARSSVWADTALATMRGALDRMVGDRRTPGGIIAAGTVGTTPGYAVSGTVSPGGTIAPEPSTLYDVASLTKVVATWPLFGDAASRALVDLDAPVSGYFPGFAEGEGGSVTPREILTHTSGLMPATRLDLYSGEARDVAEAILSEPLDSPGRHRYINRGFILLGLLLARAEGRPLYDLLDEFAHRLGLAGFQYGPLPRGEHVAPTEQRLVGGYPVHGVVHDENAHTLGGVAGHAGVFASAGALAEFARLLLAAHDGKGGLSALSGYIGESWRPATRVNASTSRGLAWLLSDGGLVYHHGFTGTSLYLDPNAGRYMVVLTNAIAYGRERLGLPELRRLAADQFA
ncbi:serine hydrolase domain-containing protein [Nocardiopsis changdeensis]|uniref:Beta-lactamase family protein n=1 Tax=Nocardiopsis changdeensis TaxID=2831969 RepID=A0ABX8BP07_9ACTN|nr:MULTISPECIES: serine hydrolase domain-containing protein [Nocardiopsis]QUX23975.1 beta-lactamase family protein [Nocardiopsis changdeensis]QYX39920.1 beta-lactamase family protein [Nocardiopsis sp. MT53]